MTSGVVVAIDPGTVRIGIAVSDDRRTLALPYEVLDAKDPAIFDRIGQIVTDKQASEVVVGLPRNLDSSEGPAAKAARAFAVDLASRLQVPVELYDERLTTVSADRSLAQSGLSGKRRRPVVDSVAAAHLLQGYLDSKKKE